METIRDDFYIGAWRIRPSLNRILRSGREIQVEPRIMHVLLCLAEHAGEVVPRDTLLETVWPGVVVTDDPLNRAISELRKYFDDDPKQPQYIETIRKVGYRLIAPIRTMSPFVQDAEPPAATGKHQGTNGQPEPHPITHRQLQGDGASVPLSREDASPDSHSPGGSSRQRPVANLRGRPRTTGVLDRIPRWLVAIVLVALAGFFWITGVSRLSDPAPSMPARPIPFTSLPGMEYDPVFSPDGSRIAFTWNGESQDNHDIYIRLLDAESMVRLTSSPAREDHPAWSPDGQYIAYVRTEAGQCALFQVPALGGSPRLLSDCNEARDLAWSPDGELLMYSDRATPAAPLSLYALSLAEGEPRQVTSPPPSYTGDSSPAFSPDGDAIVFVRSSIIGLDYIYTMPREGQPLTQRSDEHQRLEGLSWPREDLLLYTSDWNGPISLYMRSLRSGEASWIVTGGDGVHHPSADAHGTIIYEEWRWDKNIWKVNLDSLSEPPAPILASTRWDRSPTISPDGTKIAYISNRSGTYELWLWDETTGRHEVITDFGGPSLNMPRWSPDGSAIAFDLRSNGNADVYTLEIETGRVHQVTDHADNDITPAWSADMQSILHSSNRTGAWEIWETSIETGASRQVTSNGGYSALASNDGAWIYLTKDGLPGIWRLPTEGGEEEHITDALQPVDWGNWQLFDEGIYFVDRRVPPHTSLSSAEPGASLVFLDFASGAIRTIYTPDKPVANPGMAVSRDRSILLYVQIDHSESDLMRTAIP